MATGTVIPVSDYLKTVYRPDRDYVDGHVMERNLGEKDHSKLQRQFLKLFWNAACAPYFDVYQELRVQVGATRFRVPDICLLSASAPDEQIVRTPPLLCIEILSPADTLARIRVRAQDFFEMGVPEVWIVDPATRGVHLCTATTIIERTVGLLTVPGTPITIVIAEIFSALDPR